MNKKRIIFFLASLIALGVIVFLMGSMVKMPQSEQTKKMQVVASFYPLYYFASQIGGDRANVVNITPAGVEPHDHEPTYQDIAKIEKSRLLVLNGGGVEVWGGDVQKNLNAEKTTVVIVGEDLIDQKSAEDKGGRADPHVWLDPLLAVKMVDHIMQGFIKADPKNEAYYKENAAALKDELNNLDQAYRQGLNDCQEKSIITSHAAFGYMAATYGLTQVSIAGLSPDAEPSPQQLTDIVAFAKEHDVKYIFFENLVSPKLSQTIATEIGVQTLVLDPIEGLSNESIAQGKNYFTIMQDNLNNLRIALQCR